MLKINITRPPTWTPNRLPDASVCPPTELQAADLPYVAGGLNPQPLPPGRAFSFD